MKFKTISLVFIFTLLISVVLNSNLYADETSDIILKILIKKGIISQSEVDQMRAEIAKEKPVEPKGLEDRIAKLEDELKKRPKIAHFLAGDMKIGGYVQTRYTTGPSKKVNDSIGIQNSKLTVSGHIVPEIAYKLEIGPHKSPSSSILYDAFARLEYFKKANITIGQFKAPFSEEFITSSSSIKTADRALFQGTLSHEYATGLMVDGNVTDKLYYALAGVTGRDRSTSEDNEAKDVYGRLVFSPFKKSANKLLEGLQVGTAIQFGRQPRSGNNEGDRRRNLGMLKYNYKGFYFLSEYVYQNYEQIPGVDDVNARGWYALFAYKFPIKIYKYDMELEPVFKVEQYDANTNTDENRQDMYTLGLTWYLSKYFYIMTNYQFRAEQTEDSNNRFILQSQVKF